MSILQNLTEGLVNRDLAREGEAILNKWEATGLLEGLTTARSKESMSLLLENQAKQLLKEASSMAASDVEGFASVAFPIVRRVFANLLANDLVSVQPMSLPSGLIFFLDFTFEGGRNGASTGQSVYGGNVVGKEIVDGVDLATNDGGGFYNMGNAYSSPTGSITCANAGVTGTGILDGVESSALRYDPDLSGDSVVTLACVSANLTEMNASATHAVTTTSLSIAGSFNGATYDEPHFVTGEKGDLYVIAESSANAGLFASAPSDNDFVVAHLKPVRRLTTQTSTNVGTEGLSRVSALTLAYEVVGVFDVGPATLTDASTETDIASRITAADQTMAKTQANLTGLATLLAGVDVGLSIPLIDNFGASTSIGAIAGQDTWGLEEPQFGTGNFGSDTGKNEIPEIDIKVDSVAVTAITKKLKAKWSQELGQDLSAYHNLDAEVELTGILSEQIALEIDREILNDLIKEAEAGTYYWSRRPGRFVDRTTGSDISTFSNESLLGADFTGTVSEWYETLIETINDVSAAIHRKVLRGGANFVVVGPETANLLEFTSGFRAAVTHGDEKGTIGGLKAGSLSKKFDVYVDPYFPRNLVLVGRNGSSFLESGYVYAPYVPLQVTPTIFGTEDFVPRKGVLTRYAKKMVRPDMYGLVVIKDFLG